VAVVRKYYVLFGGLASLSKLSWTPTLRTLRMEYGGLPPGTMLLRFNYSDGDARRWASLGAKYRHVGSNERPAFEWRRKTGRAVAEILGFSCEYSKLPWIRDE